MHVADQADLQGNAFVEDILSQIAQLHDVASGARDVIHQPSAVSDAVRSAILNGLPNRLLTKPFASVYCNVEVLPLNVMKSFNMFLGRIPAFFTGKVEADNATLSEIHSQFGHLERYIHIAHRADEQP